MERFIKKEGFVKQAKAGEGMQGLLLAHHKLCAEHPGTSFLIRDQDIETPDRTAAYKIGNDRAFKAMLSTVPDPEIVKVRVTEDGKICIQAGRFTARLNTVRMDGYRPDIKVTTNHTPISPEFAKELLKMVGTAAEFASEGDANKDFGFVYVQGKHVFATDGFVLFRGRLSMACPVNMVFLPQEAKRLRSAWEHRELTGAMVSENTALFKTEGIWSETALVEKAPPTPLVKAVGGRIQRLVKTSHAALGGAVARILAACPGSKGSTRMEFAWHEGGIRLWAQDEDGVATAEELCPAEALESPESIQKALNAHWIKRALDIAIDPAPLMIGLGPVDHSLTFINETASVAVTISAMR